jgi:hypothetical protein
MDEYGNVRIFLLQELLDELALGAKVNDLFAMANDYYKKLNRADGNSCIFIARKQMGPVPANITPFGRVTLFSSRFDDELKKHCAYPK